MKDVLNTIDGEQRPPVNGRWLDNIEPATAAVLGRIASSDSDDVDLAWQAANAAHPSWSGCTGAERGRWMHRLADAVEANGEELARLESIDNGKPIGLARTVDIPRAVANLRFFADAAGEDRSRLYRTGTQASNIVHRDPIGVVGLISPWNLPLYLFTWKIAPALAAGNTVVAKPSELTPVTAARLGQLASEIDFPPGVLNIVHGLGSQVGESIVGHPEIPAVSFTGGTTTGARIAAKAAPMFKKLSLELGGKNPNILFEDADLELALATSLRSSFANQGQICLCGSRVLVHRPIHDRLVAELVEGAGRLRIGDPLDERTQQGALVSASHRDKIAACVELARAEGGEVLCGGRAPDSLPERCREGFFYEPTVITGVPMDGATNQQEIFGPVITVTPFDTEEEAMELANGTDYGLSASVWTGSDERATRMAKAIDAGTVWVNCWLLRDLRVPFGGVKHSGVGREGGEEAMHFFTEAKTVCTAEGTTS
ncbi:MAG: 2-hydroxymuconic semialdehyde dehydrogenase [Phycisphaerae bacterium]|nr:2-hydroxymuconic semialdehyde dehydrogenase [Phycisphaerae bacterium]